MEMYVCWWDVICVVSGMLPLAIVSGRPRTSSPRRRLRGPFAASAPFSHLTPGLIRSRALSVAKRAERAFSSDLWTPCCTGVLQVIGSPRRGLLYHDTEPWQHRLRCACSAFDTIGAMGLVSQTTRKLRTPLAFLLCLAGQAADRDVPSRALIPGRVTGPGSILELSYSHDGSSLGVLTTIGLQIRDTRSGALLKSIPHIDSSPRAFSWAPDGKRIALAADSVEIWDLERGTCERTLPTESGEVFDIIRWSPDGSLIAAGSRHQMVVFDAVSGHRTEISPAHPRSVPGREWLANWRVLVGTGRWGNCGRGGRLEHSDRQNLGRPHPEASTNYSSFASKAASHVLWRRPMRHRERPISAQVDSIVEWAPDGQVLATFSPETGLSLWDAGTGLLRRRLPAKEATISLSWSPDSKLLHAGSYHEMRFLRANTGSLEYSLVYPLHNKAADRVELSTVTLDGERQAAFYFGHGVIETWRGRQKALGQRITVGGPVGGANLSPDMQKTIAGSSWTPAAIWDLETDTELVQLQQRAVPGGRVCMVPRCQIARTWFGSRSPTRASRRWPCDEDVSVAEDGHGYTAPRWSPDARVSWFVIPGATRSCLSRQASLKPYRPAKGSQYGVLARLWPGCQISRVLKPCNLPICDTRW